MNRRDFMKITAGATIAAASAAAAAPKPVGPKHLPRWRGFNLQHKFGWGRNDRFDETDFAWMAEWGFDFVRLPMSYHCWVEEGDWLKFREDVFREIDEAVAFGRKHKIHVSVNFHRAPGYCVAKEPPEPLDLWKDEAAQTVCAAHWAHFAERYQGVPNEQLSFDLVNEPPVVSDETYAQVATRLVEAIREKDKERLVIADGGMWGRRPVRGLIGLGVAQSTRGYDPMQLTHYKASWARGSDTWPEPAWPLPTGKGKVYDREALEKRCIAPWKALESEGVGVHVGEWGAYKFTPHAVVLAWMRDCLELWEEAGWGWALWEFRGGFGLLDSGRNDVAYEDFRGHKLDRKMLDLLLQH